MRRACFIAFEGTDGSGKSTTAKLVADQMRAEGHDVHFLDKNSPAFDTGYAAYHMGKIREILWDYDDNAPLELLGDKHWIDLIAAWFHGVEKCIVEPNIARGRSVISDGWVAKYLARFLLKEEGVAACAASVFGQTLVPDAVILLDVEPEVARDRKDRVKRSESGALEAGSAKAGTGFVDYQQRVRQQLLKLADEQWIRIETSLLSSAGVSRLATDHVRRLLLIREETETGPLTATLDRY